MIKFFPIFLLFSTAVSAVDFNRDVRPILSDKCFACHGFDEAERKADLRLDTKEGAFTDLDGYFALVAGEPEESEAWLRIDLPEDDEDVMPPEKFHKKLTNEEKTLIKQWITEGAKYDLHWSYKPIQKPEIDGIDSLINKRLAQKSLKMSPAADKITLARRLHLDLLGLPPTIEAVDQFAKDKSPDAYEKLVDELLENPAFGERMAVYWLDLVRYADTIGYHSDTYMEVSAYRDYVIEAFNDNMPYDQFTIEQLAGDLLPNPTVKQKVASGYNRLLQTTEEGGAQAAEYMVIHAADRVRNVSEVWLGSTIGCAQCHDHKYDPFTARDFYSMAAFFADVKEKPIGKRQPNLKLPTPDEEKRIAELKKNLAEKTPAKLAATDSALGAKISEAQTKWEAEIASQLTEDRSDWTVAEAPKTKSSGGQTFEKLPDGSILTKGKNPGSENYVLTLKGSGKITAIRLETLTHESFVKKGLSRANGNFVLTNTKVRKSDGTEVTIASGKADFEQSGWPVANAFDGKSNTGWAVDGHNNPADHVAMFVLAEGIDLGKNGTLELEFQFRSPHQKHHFGRFRLGLTTAEDPKLIGGLNLPPAVSEALKLTSEKRSAEQKKAIADHFLTETKLLADARKNLTDWKKDLVAIEKNVKTMLASEPLPEPRMTRVLARGNWLDKDGEVVQAALPTFLPKDKDNVIAKGERANRLDLAHWIMADSNPLTARTFTNRMWKLFFGAGISRDLKDLGGQGKPPSHPEVLNLLSVEFRESGWDMKQLVKSILMSDAYKQVSTVSAEAREADPGNQLFSRQGRWRIEAEFVRDTALQLSGLLVDEKLGGKSVKPYQPAGYWQHLNFPKRTWQAGKGEDLYRRGVYTFWCRTFPHPAMVAFDAPSREECTAERPRSNIPQQALVLLNDPVFVEAAKKFGEHIATFEGGDAISQAWKYATSRNPTAEEKAVLSQLFESQKARFESDAAAAKDFLSIGEAPVSDNISAAEAAAFANVARAILNAYETTSRF